MAGATCRLLRPSHYLNKERGRTFDRQPLADVTGFVGGRKLSQNKSQSRTAKTHSIRAVGTDTVNAIGVHPRGSESLTAARRWDESVASWVAQPAVREFSKVPISYCDIPLTYYQILGVREIATHDEIWHAHQSALKTSLAEEGYSHRAISVRKEILDAAYSVLNNDLQRRDYNAHVRRSMKTVLSLPSEWLPGALILAQEVGETSLVLATGHEALQQKALKPFKRDVLLAMALAQCSLARDDFEANAVSSACSHLKASLELLQQGGEPPLRQDLQSEISKTLLECGPASVLEELSQPAVPGTLTGRSTAVRQALTLVQAALTRSPGGNQLGSNVGWFLSSALESMGADETVNGLPWEAICTSYKAGEIETDVLIRGAMAHCALGFRNREPKLVEQCGELLGLVVDREGERANVHEEMAVVALLLGLVDTALDWLADVEPPPLGRPLVAGSVEEALRALSDDMQTENREASMHNLCLFTERFLHSRVLAAFWDTRRCSPPLATYLESKRVEQHWQTANGVNTLLLYARTAAGAIHTAVESARWAVQHARAKLKSIPPKTKSMPSFEEERISQWPEWMTPVEEQSNPLTANLMAPIEEKSIPPETERQELMAPIERKFIPPKPRLMAPIQTAAPLVLEPETGPSPPESKSDAQIVVERTRGALLSDRAYRTSVRPMLPPLEVYDIQPAPLEENDWLATPPGSPRSRSASPERPALPPLEARIAAQRQEEKIQGGKEGMSHKWGQSVPIRKLAGGLLLAGFTLGFGLVGGNKVLHRAPPPQRIVSTEPVKAAPPKPAKQPRPKPTKAQLCETVPPPAAKGVIPEEVRLPDALPPAAEWKRSIPPTAVALPSMEAKEADALVRKWHVAKSDALGPKHAVGRLAEIAVSPLKTHWTRIAEDAKQGGRFWNYKLLDVTVDSAKVWRPQGGGPEEASLEVIVEEAAELVDTVDPTDNAVYYSTYRARYSLRRLEGKWRFCEGGKTR